jgi:transcriptional/translational regulatory protein YebC/TACO1
MRIGWRPKNPVKIEDAAARVEVEQYLDDLDEDDDVQHINVALEV